MRRKPHLIPAKKSRPRLLSPAQAALLLALLLAVDGVFYMAGRRAVRNLADRALVERAELAADAVARAVDASAETGLAPTARRAKELVAAAYGEYRSEGLDEAKAKAKAWSALAGLSVAGGGVYCLSGNGRLEGPARSGDPVWERLRDMDLRSVPRQGTRGLAELRPEGPSGENRAPLILYREGIRYWKWTLLLAAPEAALWRELPLRELGKSAWFSQSRDGYESFVLDGAGGALLLGEGGEAADKEAWAAFIEKMEAGAGGPVAYPWRAEAGGPVRERRVAYRRLPGRGWIVATWAWADSPPRALARLQAGFAASLVALSLFVAIPALWWVWRTQRRTRESLLENAAVVEAQVVERTALLESRNTGLEAQLGENKRARERLEKTNRELSAWVDDLTETSREIAMLNQMNELLHACRTVEETDSVMVRLGQELFPNDSGALCRFDSEQSLFETVAVWGAPMSREEDFLVEDCWALRRGRVYATDEKQDDLICGHLPQAPLHGYVCLPMMAQGEILGLLHVQWGAPDAALSEETRAAQRESKQLLAATVTEQFSLALANLKLREMLRVQSIRDPLTGLYNRRHMEESLNREVHRAKRRDKPMSVLMLDVDHFKRFNDTLGHEEGDALLREMGALLRANSRQEDIVCRYGGEEFLVILPEAPIEVAQRRAERIRERVRASLKRKERTVTVSIGVAVYPEHGSTSEAVVGAADQALYRAKNEGRDRVVLWEPAE